MDPMTSSSMRSNVETASHLVNMENLLGRWVENRENTARIGGRLRSRGVERRD
jgi:hypothetical protein